MLTGLCERLRPSADQLSGSGRAIRLTKPWLEDFDYRECFEDRVEVSLVYAYMPYTAVSIMLLGAPGFLS